MADAPLDTDVLIVGAGPVGLFLANECARRGLRFRLIEAHASQSVHSKALAIFPRTLEILDMAGLVGPFIERANPVTAVAVVAHGRRLAHLRFAPEKSPYPLIAMVPQSVTEAAAGGGTGAQGGPVEYETTLVSAVDRGDRVSATRRARRTAHSTHRRVRRRLRRGAQHGPPSPGTAVRGRGVPRIRSCWPTSRRTMRCRPASCSCARASSARSRSFR